MFFFFHLGVLEKSSTISSDEFSTVLREIFFEDERVQRIYDKSDPYFDEIGIEQRTKESRSLFD